MLALKSLKLAQSIDALHPEAHRCFVRFWSSVHSLVDGGVSNIAALILDEERNKIVAFNGGIMKGLIEMNTAYGKKSKSEGQLPAFMAGSFQCFLYDIKETV